jgi:hypothetical protein
MLLFNQHDEPDADFVHEMERLAGLVADVERIHHGVPPEVLAGNDAPILDRWILARRTVPSGGGAGHDGFAAFEFDVHVVLLRWMGVQMAARAASAPAAWARRSTQSW